MYLYNLYNIYLYNLYNTHTHTYIFNEKYIVSISLLQNAH